MKKGVFSEKGGGNSVNGGFGKDFYREGNSVKRFGRFSEPPDCGGGQNRVDLAFSRFFPSLKGFWGPKMAKTWVK